MGVRKITNKILITERFVIISRNHHFLFQKHVIRSVSPQVPVRRTTPSVDDIIVMGPKTPAREAAYARAVHLIIAEQWTLEAALAEVKNGTNKSTLHRHVKHAREGGIRKRAGAPSVLRPEQEQEIVKLCQHFASRGAPVVRKELAQLVQDRFGPTLPRFKDGRPGRDWIDSFLKRHKLNAKIPSRPDLERIAAASANDSRVHLANIASLIDKFNIDASRLFFLDECGMKDCLGANSKEASVATGYRFDRRAKAFKIEASRFSVMACVCASGDSVQPLWVFKGDSIPERSCTRPNGSIFKESAASRLPADSIVTTRVDRAGKNTQPFIEWCKMFVLRVSYFTRNNRKVLLLYDSSRCHLSFNCLQLLASGNVEAYALPSQMAGISEPIHASVFSSFRHHVNEASYRTSTSSNASTEASVPISIFEVCDAFKTAYDIAFSRANICNGFEQSGLDIRVSFEVICTSDTGNTISKVVDGVRGK